MTSRADKIQFLKDLQAGKVPDPEANPFPNVDFSKENLHNISNQDLCIYLDYCNRKGSRDGIEPYSKIGDDLFDQLLARVRENKLTDVDWSFLGANKKELTNGSMLTYLDSFKRK